MPAAAPVSRFRSGAEAPGRPTGQRRDRAALLADAIRIHGEGVMVRTVGFLLGLSWEAPQSLLGALTLAAQRLAGNVEKVEQRHGRLFVKLRGAGAVSLGYFVFWSTRDTAFVRVNPDNDLHEWGHARQSRLLGPSYLLVVGLPSTLRAMFAAAQWLVTRKPWDGYYDGFPEDWADRLGGVRRR